MQISELIDQAKRLLQEANSGKVRSALYETIELFRKTAGEKSAFYINLSKLDLSHWGPDIYQTHLVDALNAFINHLEKGLLTSVSFARQAQMVVVSDYLDQAQLLLETQGVHPAAPAVIIGASLEEFLRGWVEEESIILDGKKSCIDTYAKALREKDLISKQDIKDITSWGGIRNHAAHGEWEEVKDKGRIRLMLEGVNLFMRKYSL